MPVSEEFIYNIRLQAQEAFNTADRLQKQLRDIGKEFGGLGRANPFTDAKKQMAGADRYWGVFGDSISATKEKMGALDSTIRKLTNQGLDKNSGAVKALKAQYDTLSKSGGSLGKLTNIFDSITGGKASAAMGSFSKVASGMGLNMASLGATAGVVGIAIAGVAIAWEKALLPGIKFNMMLEEQEVAFRVMLGSAEKASTLMNDLKKLSLSTPIGFGEGATGAKQLLAYGFAQGEIIDNMKMLGTVASATGTRVGDLVYVYGTLRAQGRAYTRDLMQFGMRGIPIYEYLARTLGVSVREIKALTESGQIGFPEVERAMQAMTKEGGRFGGMLEETMKTQQGAATVMKNTWELFTAELAKPLAPAITTFFKQITKLIKAIAPIFELITGLLALMAPYLLAFWEVSVAVWQIIGMVFALFQQILKALGSIKIFGVTIEDIFTRWHEPLGEVTSAFDKILDLIKSMSEWINFIVKGDFKGLQAWWDEFWGKKGPIVAKELFVPIKAITPKNDDVRKYVADFQKQMASTRIGVKDSPLLTAKEVTDFQKQINMINKDVSYSWSESLGILVKGMGGIPKILYDSLLAKGPEMAQDFWNVFKRMKPSGLTDDLFADYEKGTEAAIAYTAQFDRNILVAKNIARDMGKDTSNSIKEVENATSNAFSSIMSDLAKLQNEAILDPKRWEDSEFKRFYDELIKKAKEYQTEAGKSAEAIDIVKQYMEFSSSAATDAMRLSSPARGALMERMGQDWNTEGIQDDPLSMRLALIKDRFKELRAEIIATQPELVTLVDEMERLELAGEWLKEYIELDKVRREVSIDSVEYSKALTNEMNNQIALNSILYKGEMLRLQNEKTKLEYMREQAALARGENTSIIQNKATTAIAGGLDKVTQGRAFGLEAELNKGTYNKDALRGLMKEAGSYMAAGYLDILGGSMLSAASGTEMAGTLFGGADPLTQVIKAFAEMLMSIENVNKALNWASTMMEGTKAVIEGPLNEALQPFINALTAVGELLGAILLPIIDILADSFGAMFGWIAPIAKIFSALFKALRPLLKLFMQIAQPFRFLLEMLSQLFAVISSVVDATSAQAEELEDTYDQQVKALQDLYEVGALSGAEYEARLAALRGGEQPELAGTTEATAIFSDLFAQIAELADVVLSLVNMLSPVLAPLMELMLGFVNMIAGFLGGMVESLVGLFELVDAFFKGDLDGVWKGFLKLLWGLLRMLVNPLISGINSMIRSINSLAKTNFAVIPLLKTFSEQFPKGELDPITTGGTGTGISTINTASGSMALPPSPSASPTIVYNINVEGNILSERDFYKNVGENLDRLRRQGYT